jgi:hypothetical protein
MRGEAPSAPRKSSSGAPLFLEQQSDSRSGACSQQDGGLQMAPAVKTQAEGFPRMGGRPPHRVFPRRAKDPDQPHRRRKRSAGLPFLALVPIDFAESWRDIEAWLSAPGQGWHLGIRVRLAHGRSYRPTTFSERRRASRGRAAASNSDPCGPDSRSPKWAPAPYVRDRSRGRRESLPGTGVPRSFRNRSGSL